MDIKRAWKLMLITLLERALCTCAKSPDIKQHLDRTSAETLVHAFVSSKIDGLNSMLCGLPDFRLGKLQLLQNAAARLTAI